MPVALFRSKKSRLRYRFSRVLLPLSSTVNYLRDIVSTSAFFLISPVLPSRFQSPIPKCSFIADDRRRWTIHCIRPCLVLLTPCPVHRTISSYHPNRFFKTPLPLNTILPLDSLRGLSFELHTSWTTIMLENWYILGQFEPLFAAFAASKISFLGTMQYIHAQDISFDK